MVDLQALVAVAEGDGWASGMGDIESVRRQAAFLRWGEVSVGHVEADSALHTFGADLDDPPDFVVLIGQRPSAAPSRLWSGPDISIPSNSPISAALGHGMFLVSAGRESFYAPAFSDRRYRYDARCMIPCDARAHDVVQFISQRFTDSIIFEWRRAGQVLLVDNRRALHTCSAAHKEDVGADIVVLAFRVVEKP